MNAGGLWAREFVALNKGTFIGRDAVLREREEGGIYRLVMMAVDPADGDPARDESILHNDWTVGWVTSGGYAHTHDMSLAIGYVRKESAAATEGFGIEIMGQQRWARRLEQAPFDPEGLRMRA